MPFFARKSSACFCSARGAKPTTPADLTGAGGGYGFGCKDPDGRNLGFVCGAADHADTADQADVPRKIAHINLNAKDFDGSLAFFTGIAAGDLGEGAAIALFLFPVLVAIAIAMLLLARRS